MKTNDNFGEELFSHLAEQAKLLGRRLNSGEFKKLVQDFYEQSEKPTPKKIRARNVLLDAFVTACGADVNQAGKMHLSTAAIALRDILGVCPDLTVEELQARVAKYKKINPQWTLTETAIAKWWSKLGTTGGAKTNAEANDIYVEPEKWRYILKSMYDLSTEAVMDKQWFDLGPDTRKEILRNMKDRQRQQSYKSPVVFSHE
tara:strand:+ start:846 stop:1451 length:606 start_codon:yes stop_codon:yes gene_type:complete